MRRRAAETSWTISDSATRWRPAGLDPATFERWHSDLPKAKGSDAFLSVEFHLE